MNKKQYKNLRGVLSFKKWSRASYAVFNTVSRVVNIRVLSLASLTAVGIVQIVAQGDSTLVRDEKVDLEELVVTAETVPQLQSEVARIVSVISKKEIEASGATSLPDLLECVLNVDVRQRGLHGVQSDVSIRGGSFDQVMVLLNGINITDPQTGHHTMNLPLNIESVERIEVLNGPGARHLGANAFSGAINIITKTSEKNQLSLGWGGGHYGFQEGNASVSLQTGRLSSFLSTGYKKSDGYIENTDFQNKDVFYHGVLGLVKDKLDLQLGYQDKKFGSNAFYTPLWPDQFEQTKTSFASLKYTTGTKLKFSPSIYYRQNYDRFELFREDTYNRQGNYYVNGTDTARYYPDVYAAWNYYSGHNYHFSQVAGANVNGHYFWNAFGKTTFGATSRYESILSNQLKASELNEPIPVAGEEAFYTKQAERTIYSVYLGHVFSHALFNIGFGMMGNYSKSLNEAMTFYPGIDLNVKLAKSLHLKLSSSKSLRLPTFTDLYYNGSSNVGNENLKPETAVSYEGGLNYATSGFSAHATVFHRKGENLIDWIKGPEDTKWRTENMLEMKTFGTEFYARIDPNVFFKSELPVQMITLSASTLNSDKESGEYMSKYVLDYLRFKAGASATFYYKNLFLNMEYVYQERAGAYELYIDKVSQGDVNYDPFALLNAKLWYQLKQFKTFVEASNVLNKTYVDIGNVPQPGRWIRVGIQFNVDF